MSVYNYVPPALIRCGMYAELYPLHRYETESMGLLDKPLGRPTDRLPPRTDGRDKSHRDKAVVIGVRVTAEDVEFLLVRQRKKNGNPGNWGPVHGGLEASFSIEQLKKINGRDPELTVAQAQSAEFYQETGGILSPGFLSYSSVHFTHDRRYHCVIAHFRDHFTPKPIDEAEIVAARWTPARDCVALLRGGYFAKHMGECFLQAVGLLSQEVCSCFPISCQIIESIKDATESILEDADRIHKHREGLPFSSAPRRRLKPPVITGLGPVMSDGLLPVFKDRLVQAEHVVKASGYCASLIESFSRLNLYTVATCH